MTLEGIRIKNFQAWEKFFLKFGPRITTIIGPNDIGKSSLFRALHWCCFNKPSGKAFIREGTTDCRVQVRVEGVTIERRRRGTENSYLLEGSEYRSFGTDPPERVSQLLNLDEVNFQWQHNPLFWLPLSPGQVAKALNRIVDLSIMDRAVKLVSQEVRQAESLVDVHDRLLKDAQAERESLDWVKVADVSLGKIETLKRGIEDKGSRRLSLKRSLEDRKDLEKARELALQAASVGCRLLERAQRVVEVRERAEGLRSVVMRISDSQEIIRRCRREIGDVKKRFPRRCPLCSQPIPKAS